MDKMDIPVERPGAGLLIQTMRFGAAEAVEVAPAHLYTFPEALPGLPESHRYALIADAAYAPLCWLQSLDEAVVCLPAIGPGAIALDDYLAQVGRATGLSMEDVAARVLLVTRHDAASGRFVANMLAPIVLDPATGTGAQIVLEGHTYPLRQPLEWQAETRTFSISC
jgi:flagellar assembly factor FliW